MKDSAAAHALDALPQDEAELIESLASVNPRLRDELDSYRRVAAELIEGLLAPAPAPPPALWERISKAAGITNTMLR